MDILAEMPKFPKRQSKVPLMELHLSANLALFVTDQCPVNGTPPVSQLSLVKMPIPSTNVTRIETDPADRRQLRMTVALG
ncbi:hypothetical protein JHK82_031257 [Glycine max]|nr:hypothetical protein JHK82_031257 [Glycine max]